MVSPEPDAWAQGAVAAHSNRVSAKYRLRCRATGIQGQRQLGRNPIQAGISLCGDPNTDGGAISVDAGTPIDSGVTVLDGGSVDAGPTIDGGPAIDAGPMSDAGAATDGGGETPRDAGTTDGGKSDAGSRSDAGEEVVVDAGSAEDIVTYATSCGCSGGAALPMMLLALGLFRRRRST